jgi:hypothetical protein
MLPDLRDSSYQSTQLLLTQRSLLHQSIKPRPRSQERKAVTARRYRPANKKDESASALIWVSGMNKLNERVPADQQIERSGDYPLDRIPRRTRPAGKGVSEVVEDLKGVLCEAISSDTCA